MAEYDAVVYDLDGTLVRLMVDWEAVERDLASLLTDSERDPAELDAWELLSAAEDIGLGEPAEYTISAYEREGARAAVRLNTADEVPSWDIPVGVCSLNCEAACRIALEGAGLLEKMAVVIGRDSHPTRKPDPGPLLAALDAMDARPEESLFIGDSYSDEVTADRAGVNFRSVPSGRTSR